MNRRGARALVAVTTAAVLAAAATACGRSHHGAPRAPQVAFTISDGTLPFGGCATADQGELIHPTPAASRGACLYLDARGTVGADGAPGAFAFTYSWSTTGGEIVLAQTTAELVAIGTNTAHALPIGSVSRFLAVARDPQTDASGSATALFTALDGAPHADAGAVRILPVDGYPWVDYPLIATRFDASRSTDPDGDPLVYCFGLSAIDPPLCSTDPRDPEFIRALDVSAESRYFFPLTVTDGIDESVPSVAQIDVRTEGEWSYGAGTFARVDPGRSTVALASTSAQALSLAILPGSPETLVAAVRAPGASTVDLLAAPLPAASPFSAPLDTGLAAPTLVGDAAGSRVWVLGSGAQMSVLAVPVAGGATPSLGAPVTATLAPFLGATAAPRVGEVVGDALWVGAGDRLLSVDPDGTVTPLAQAPGYVFRALAARPAHDEVWALIAPDPASGGASGGAVSVEVLDLQGAVVDGIEADELVDGLVFLGPDELVARLSDALVDVDPASLLATQTFAAERWRASIGAASALRLDRPAGIFWAAGLDPITRGPVTWRVRRDGSAFPFSGAAFPDAIESATGALWFASPGALTRAFTPQLSTGLGETGTFPSPGALMPSRAAHDERTGGLWVLARSPVTGLDEILHVSADASRIDEVTSAVDGATGATVPLPNLVSLRVEPGSRSILALDQSPTSGAFTLREYDFSTDPPTMTALLDDAALAPMMPYEPIIEPSAPIMGVPTFVWLARLSAPPYELEQYFFDTGTAAPAFTIPAAERDPTDPTLVDARAALYRGSDALCLATVESNAAIHVRRIRADTQGEFLGDLIPDPADPDPWSGMRVATSWAPDGELCWAAARTSPTSFDIAAWDPGGTLVHSLSRAGAILVEMDPVTNDELRLVWQDSATGDTFLEPITFPASSGPLLPWNPARELVRLHQSH